MQKNRAHRFRHFMRTGITPAQFAVFAAIALAAFSFLSMCAISQKIADSEAKLHLISAEQFYERGDFANARKEVSLANFSSQDLSARKYDLIGSSYLSEQKYPQAEEAFLAGLKNNSENSQLHDGLGVAYYQQGKKSLAAIEYRRAVDLDPSNQSAVQNLDLINQENADQ